MAATNPNSNIFPATRLKLIVVSSVDQDPRPSALYIGVTGTMDITNDDGSTEAAVPVIAGGQISFQASRITAIGGGAKIYGLYHNVSNFEPAS